MGEGVEGCLRKGIRTVYIMLFDDDGDGDGVIQWPLVWRMR